MQNYPEFSSYENSKPIDTSKYYEEIGAEIIGNQLMIRVEKDRNKSKKSSEWEPPCDCEMTEIKRPTRKTGPRIINVGENNEIVFKLNSGFHLETEDPNFRPETLSYRLADPNSESGHMIQIHPQLEGPGLEEIQRGHMTIGNQNIFMMRIKKDADAKELQKRNIELEINYPTLPPRILTPPPTPPPQLPPEPIPIQEIQQEILEPVPVTEFKKKKKGKSKKRKTKGKGKKSKK